MSDENKRVNNTQEKNKDFEDIVFYKNNPKSQQKVPQHYSTNNVMIKSVSAKHTANKKNLSKGRIVLNIVSVFLGIIFIVAGSGFIVAYSCLNRINFQALENSIPESSSSIQQNSQTSSISDTSTTIVEPYNGDLLNDPMVLNIMLFGDDRRSEDTSGNSDTMILLSIDTRHKKIKMLSFLRDTYVSIPGYGEDRINAAYPIGGAGLAVQTVESNFGIHIDRYAIVDFNSFLSIIDTIGGIDIELTDEEIDYINWQCWKNNQVETRDEIDINSFTFYENSDGEMVTTVHLNSRQALWHARNRGQDGICSGDDFTRTQRQRNVISTVINKLKDSDFSTLLSVIYEIGPMITTNLKTSEITSLATNVMKYLSYDIVSQSLPESNSIGLDYYFDKIDSKEVICIYSWSDFRRKVAEFIYEDSVTNIAEVTSD